MNVLRQEKLHVDGSDVWKVPYLRTSGIRKVGYLLMTRQNMQINVHVMSLKPRRGAQGHPFEHLRQAMDSIVGAAMIGAERQSDSPRWSVEPRNRDDFPPKRAADGQRPGRINESAQVMVQEQEGSTLPRRTWRAGADPIRSQHPPQHTVRRFAHWHRGITSIYTEQVFN